MVKDCKVLPSVPQSGGYPLNGDYPDYDAYAMFQAWLLGDGGDNYPGGSIWRFYLNDTLTQQLIADPHNQAIIQGLISSGARYGSKAG